MKNLINAYKKILPSNRIITDPSSLEKYNKSWIKHYKGNSPLALLPSSTSEISKILKTSSIQKTKIQIQSGRTSLVGGTTAENFETILSLEKFSNFSFNPKTGILKAEAGALLKNIQNELIKHNFETPFDLGSRGSCMIGGNISTNAGGINYVKYGGLRNYVLGLEVVLASGEVLDMMKSVQKDNTGVDLKQLFIGAEGALGIVSKVCLLCKEGFKERKVFLIRVKGFENVVDVVREGKNAFFGSLQAVEYVDFESFVVSCKGDKVEFFDLDCLENYRKNFYGEGKIIKDRENRDHFLLLEIGGNDEEYLDGLIGKFLEKTEDKIFDSLMADDKSKQERIWNVRENITLNLSNFGKILKYDLSLSFDLFEDIIDSVQREFCDDIYMATGYGHIGDGNIHLQVIFEEGVDIQEELVFKINEFIYGYIMNVKGSISAEHGIGLMKIDYLENQKSEVYLKYVEEIKKLFDPDNILNPGKTIKIKNSN